MLVSLAGCYTQPCGKGPAHADLDCDGVMSTFQRYGKGDPNAAKGECSIVGAAALYTQNETE